MGGLLSRLIGFFSNSKSSTWTSAPKAEAASTASTDAPKVYSWYVDKF